MFKACHHPPVLSKDLTTYFYETFTLKDIKMLHDKRVFDAAVQSGDDFGDLPEWDLSDLYSSETAPELSHDLEWLNNACVDFANDFEGNLASLNSTEMLDAVHRYEKIDLKTTEQF